jgi:hypothetical protein
MNITSFLLSAIQANSSEPSPKKLPFTSRDLVDSDVGTLSMAGAHSYISTKVDYLGLPPIFYRQFSDWAPVGPLFDPILALHVLGEGERPVETNVKVYEWQPDRVKLAVQYGDLVEGEQIIGYVGGEGIVAVIKLCSLTDRPVVIKLSGAVSPKVESSSVEPYTERNGFRVTVQHRHVHNPWGYPPSQLDQEWFIGTNLTGLVQDVTKRTYSAKYRLPGGAQTEIRLVFVPGEMKTEMGGFLEDPFTSLDSTTNQVDSWLAVVKKPQLTDERMIRMYYNSWYQFWHNIESAKGFWSRSIITPSKLAYGRGIWLWDSAFHIFALIHGGKQGIQLAKDQVVVLAEGSKAVGHLPREVWVDAVSPEIQPPGILTWAAMEIYKQDKDEDFLAQIYEDLASNNEWFYENRDLNHNGLCEWAGGDSGWDTSPRWDEGEVEAVDLNCWLYLDQVKLAEMASVLGKDGDAKKWREKADVTKDLVRDMLWDEQDGCYYDRNPRTGKLVKVKTPATFWTMFAGVATAEQAEKMVELVADPNTFGTKYPMPSVGVSEPTHEPNNYWRGPTWINLNWISILGLEKYGYRDLAKQLRDKSLEVIAMNPVPYEYYNPHTGKGIGASNYMWTAALFIVMANER